MGHYIENTGDGPLRFLEAFRSDHFADMSLNQWLKLSPAELVRSHLQIGPAVLDHLLVEKRPVLPGR